MIDLAYLKSLSELFESQFQRAILKSSQIDPVYARESIALKFVRRHRLFMVLINVILSTESP
jgi:hypothetical protein